MTGTGSRGSRLQQHVCFFVQPLGKARRTGLEHLEGRHLGPRVDRVHQPKRRPQPVSLVGCPVDDRRVGVTAVDTGEDGTRGTDDLATRSVDRAGDVCGAQPGVCHPLIILRVRCHAPRQLRLTQPKDGRSVAAFGRRVEALTCAGSDCW